MFHETFQHKANRDARVKELKEEGYFVKVSSVHNQQLHPMYVKDYGVALTAADRSFGNDLYRTYFAVLYSVEYSRREVQ